MNVPHILLAAGGTAGHVHPAVAVAEEMRRRGWIVSFAGTARGSEREILRRHGDEPHLLTAAPFHRVTPAGRALALMLVPVSVLSAAMLLRRLRIDGVIGFGGYASIGPVLAARMLRRFSAIVEPNVDFGMANRMLRRFADRVYAGLHTEARDANVLRTGTIIRSAVRQPLPPRVVASTERVFLIGSGLSSEPIDDPWPRYAAADLIVCRGGAGTLAEVAAVGRAAIIVPLADAAEDHQSRNAMLWSARGAAVVMTEAEWAAHGRDEVDRLLRDEAAREAMAARARELAVYDAAERIVDDIAAQLETR